MNEMLIHAVIDEIFKEHNVTAQWKDFNLPGIDGKMKLDYRGHAQDFHVMIKKELREYQLPIVFRQHEEYAHLMILAERLFPKIKEALARQGIAYVDMNGNVGVETDNILLKVEGKGRKYLHREKHGRAFTKAGLKALFLFLANENDINDTYREIAKKAGIALGNVKLILDGLLEEGYALRVNEKELKLTDMDQLLQKWTTAYAEKLKPTLKVGNFRFNNRNEFKEWKNIKLDTRYTKWGGEPAGNVYTKYLQPEYLTLYTREKRADLMKNYRLIPDPEGNVMVYNMFWEEMGRNSNVVPPVIAYADLMVTGKRRCIETAQKIYEERIENTF